VITPAELAARNTDLSGEAFTYLQRLTGSWGSLSDLSFSDLLLLVPLSRSTDGKLLVLGQIRPTTGATLLRVDLVGHVVEAADWPVADEALHTRKISVGTVSVAQVLPSVVVPGDGERGGTGTLSAERGLATALAGLEASRLQAELVSRDASPTGEVPVVGERAQLECLPVIYKGAVVAVVARVEPLGKRRTDRLERVYRDLYHRLAAMVAAGEFPHAGEEVMTEDAPRVGDGLLVTDIEGRITYASPNAMSALHRMGVSDVLEGHRLSELGVEETAVDTALASGRPVIEEAERRPDVIVLVHCTPLLNAGSVTGAMVLLRDVTDLRRLDRLLLTKDAAIREVHHRVKNNLQTISSLLRLQGRRLEEGKGRAALREAERRVRSIAVVHEILSHDPGDQVPFVEIVEALVRMTEDSFPSGQQISMSVVGDPGDLSADVATPLAVALAELLQNAVEHAFSEGAEESHQLNEVSDAGKIVGGHVRLLLANDGRQLTLQVRDDGRGVPEGFDIDHTTSLGLTIVRDLIQSQLGGNISIQSAGGTVVTIHVPLTEPAQQFGAWSL
jgi:two-component sensor histidine kinase